MNKPLEEQAAERGFPSPDEAFHDDADGMYKMKEPEKPSFDEEKVVQLESGLLVPRPPEQKETRVIWTDSGAGHFQYQVAESYEECIERIEEARALEVRDGRASGWINFTDPIFGFRVAVPLYALTRPVAIVTKLEDIEALREQMKAYEMQKRLARIESAKRGGASPQAAAIIERANRKN